MKSIFKHILIPLLPLLVWAGCERENITTTTEGIPDHCIEITLGGVKPVLSTKASSRGADAYNENLVESVDCFFYTDGGTGSNAVFTALGRGAEAVAESDSTIYKVKVFFTDADAIKMFGNKNSGTCQLYVICNAPLSYDMNHSSVDELKELVVENDFTAQTVQGSFVMSADNPATVTLTTTGEGNNQTRSASGRIKVSRAAAKIQFFLHIPDEFEDEAHQVWEPVLDAGIGISMSNAVKRGKVDGEYTVQASDYVSYGSRALTTLNNEDLVTGHEDYKYTHVPFYSYPCAWSDLSDYATTVVFRIAWRIVGETNYQWKKYQLSPNISTLDLERNKFYRTFVNVRSLGGADKESFVVIPECDYEIIPWMNESASGGGQGVVPGELITYKYLVVDLPEQTIFNETTAYYTYVSSSPVSSVKIDSVYYYVNTSASPKTGKRVNVTVTADSQNVTTDAGTVTVNKATPGLVTLYHALDNMYSAVTIIATITNADGCTQKVSVEQNPSISLVRNTSAGDVFVNGFFARVRNATFGTSYTQNNVSYKYAVPGGTNGTNNITPPSDTPYGTVSKGTNMDSSISSSFYTTVINVTSFNEDNDTYSFTFSSNTYEAEYRIGDPRVEAGSINPSWSVSSYLYGMSGNNGLRSAWTSPEKIMIASQAEDDRNIIAPSILVSSALNAMSGGVTFENAVKRGATYQEAGYPAGRWRLPTEAEMAFIVSRQKDGTIPNLYATNTLYWAASGRLLYVPANAASPIEFRTPANGASQSCRFVYDLWYWGDEPSTTNVYHPNGHLYNYDSSGNATLIR